MWAFAPFDLGKIRLAERFAQFPLHLLRDFGLGHRAAQPAHAALDSAQMFEFLIEFHDGLAWPFYYLL
jgi:hypothetical protein